MVLNLMSTLIVVKVGVDSIDARENCSVELTSSIDVAYKTMP